MDANRKEEMFPLLKEWWKSLSPVWRIAFIEKTSLKSLLNEIVAEHYMPTVLKKRNLKAREFPLQELAKYVEFFFVLVENILKKIILVG